MSSFTDYHKKWKEENGKTEDVEYRQKSINEIQKSTDEYVNSMFGKEGNIWHKIKTKASDNLNRSNSMQNVFDRNTRKEMAKPMENYTNTKRMAMQNASKYVQENAVQQPVVEEKNIWDKIKEKLQIGMDSNRVSIYRDSSGKIDRNKTALGIAQQNFEADKQKLRMLENKKAYDKAINEQLKNTWSYKEVQRQNPDATEEELLKITKEKDKKASQEFIESLVAMNPAERNAKIDGITHNKNEKYALKSQVQARETQKEADEINKDIQDGNYLSSIGHIVRGLPEGAMNAVIKTTTALESLSGNKAPSFVSHSTDPVKEAELQTRKYQEITSKIDNGIVQTGSGVTNTIGEMTPAMIANIGAPGYGAVVNAMNVGSSGYLDTLNEDGSNKGQSLLTGVLKATASYGIEKIAGGNFLSEGSLDDWAAKTIASKTSSKAGRKIASMIYNVGGEVLEEELENQVDYLIDATINGKGITLKEWLDEQGETVKNTALTQLTLSLFGLGGDTYKKANEYSQDSEAKRWINEAQKIIDKENLQIDTEKIKERELRSVLNQVNVKETNQANNKSNLQQNTIYNQNNSQTGQINSQENKMFQNQNMEQIKIDSKNFARQVDDYIAGKVRSNDLINVGKTSQVLQSVGLPDNDIVLKQSKLKSIMEDSNNPNDKLHGIPLDTIKRIPEALNNPLNVLKSSTHENSVVVITDLADKLERPIIASIEMDYNGKIGNVEFLSNRLTSAYGKNNYDRFMQTEIEKGNLLYDIDEGIIKELTQTRVQSPARLSSFEDTVDNVSSVTNSIAQNDNSVKNTINNSYMQNNYNNSNYFKTAKKYNLPTDNNSIKGIYEVASKRGINVFYDDTAFTNSKQNAKWIVGSEGNRSVILNPNANTDTAMQSVMIHELTHDFEGTKEYNKISSMVLEKLKSSSDYDNMMLDIAKAYENEYKNMSKEQFRNMIEKEAVADYLGENLGNQEFVNDLVRSTNRSQIQKIIDWVKNKITSLKNTVTGNKELNYWNKVKENFERAYNQEYRGNNLNERFSIQTDKNGNQYVKVDTNQDIFEGKSISEQTKIAKEYILNNFREKGLLKDNDNINVSRKTANEYTHPKKGLDDSIYSSKLKASTELDNLLKISQFIKSVPDDGRHIFAKDGWDYYETIFKIGDKIYSGWLNIANGRNGKLLYDITNIKERANNYSVKTVSVDDSFINNSILPTKENVNSSTNNKYIQESENNSGSFNLPISDKLSKQSNGSWQQYLKDTSINKGTRESLKDIRRIPISEENLQRSNLANNGKTVYNNTESEGGMDEESRRTKQDDKRRVQELFEKYERGETDGTSNSKELLGNQATKKITEQEVKKTLIDFANKYSKTELNENEIKLKNIINNLGGDVVFYEFGDNNIFEGLANKNTFYIDILGESKTDNVFYHELTHYLTQNNNEIYMNEIQPIVNEIASDYDYQEAIFNYANSSEEYFDVRKLDGSLQNELAEEVVADQIASIYGDLEADYGLDREIKERLKTSMDKILTFNENLQEQINTTSQLKEVEANIPSLGYKPDIEGKQRKHYKSIIESDQVGNAGKKVAEGLVEIDTYQPISNIETLAKANESIARNGVDNTYIAFKTKMNSNERITLQDIAIGERLIQIFSQNGNIEKYNDLMQDVVILGTEVGQILQAFNLIKKQSPEGQLMFLKKVIERTNIKENADLKVTDEMEKRILEAKGQEELENVMTDIAVELGSELPVSMGDKVRSWRYLSMLGNPKTHIKNLGANVAMNVTQLTKNKVAGAMEDVVGIFNKDMERTKTLRPANKDQRNFAKQDAEFMKDKIDGGGKYDIKNTIQSNKKQFDNKVLNRIANFNSDMLELEDNIFLKKAYQQSIQNYMSANKLSSSDMQNSSVLQKAREYASYQAQEATFHQFSELAQRLTEIENKGGIAGKTLEAVVPFKKTPINIAKSGVEYSPIGLAKSLTYDIVQLNKKTNDYKVKLEKGFISEAEYKTGTSKLVTKTIDNMAKGLTGTSLALLGYALRDMEILKSGNDGEDDEFKEKLGEQEYAIKIGDSTYTLDWVSPSAIPMFIGATVHDLTHSEKEDNSNTLNSLMTSSAKALEPMTEMSMLQGLTSAISSYEQGSSNMLFDLGGSAVSSYFGQFVPTALGQVAKTIDDKERDTSSTEKGLAKKVEQFKKQQMAKIPIVSKIVPARKDVWGNEKTRDSNILVRAYEVGLAPYNRKKVVEDYTEKELLKVFRDTGEKSVLPGIPNKDITINKQKYRLTAGEYNKAKETFGKTSKGMLDSLVKSKEYKSLTDEQKSEAINNIYSYAKEKIKVDYAKNKKKEIETTPSYNILKELNSPSNQSEYLSYSSKIKGIEKDKEKKKILSDGNYSLGTKAIIYKNTLGKEDDIYNNVLGKDNININEYLKYKLQEFESDKKDDGTKNGKSISGSKKKKVSAYVDNMNITRVQKLAILGTQYKLKRVEQEQLYNYLEKLPMKSQAERLEVFSKYSSNFVIYEDNTMDFK